MKHAERFGSASWALIVVTLGGLLAGCVNKDKSDLDSYVTEVLKRPGGQIEPLPPIKPYERYLYQSADAHGRDPFQSFVAKEPKKDVEQSPGTDAVQQHFVDEITTHNREDLEEFELDSLRMVGTLQNNDEMWGIVKDNAGTVHRVQTGNYLGRNYGKILNIQEDRIDLREIVKDSDGRWEERQANLALTDDEGKR
ncbi:MAG: pilus assembly protein PilP [Gammaproteobacteria bacterium]|nr:pilus assembly protein PilP [Gammaproteobacteria bacterium]